MGERENTPRTVLMHLVPTDTNVTKHRQNEEEDVDDCDDDCDDDGTELDLSSFADDSKYDNDDSYHNRMQTNPFRPRTERYASVDTEVTDDTYHNRMLSGNFRIYAEDSALHTHAQTDTLSVRDARFGRERLSLKMYNS